MRLPIAAVAEKLQKTLGQRIASYAIGIKDPRAIGKYARSAVAPRSDVEVRLRHLYIITQILMTRDTAETIRAWMLGANPLLEDKAPVQLLHEEDHKPVTRAVEAEAPPALATVSTEPFCTVLDAAESFATAA